ncbi:MAG: hypothetical protein ACQEQV_04480 [Fibrobacterota bacterium]
MKISNFGATRYAAQGRNSKKAARKSSDSFPKNERGISQRRDSYTSSRGPVKARNISEVRQRIQNNFYNSDTVNEDLSNLFSKIFRKFGQ